MARISLSSTSRVRNISPCDTINCRVQYEGWLFTMLLVGPISTESYNMLSANKVDRFHKPATKAAVFMGKSKSGNMYRQNSCNISSCRGRSEWKFSPSPLSWPPFVSLFLNSFWENTVSQEGTRWEVATHATFFMCIFLRFRVRRILCMYNVSWDNFFKSVQFLYSDTLFRFTEIFQSREKLKGLW